MKQIMEMGGAYEGKYGQSIEVYTAIQRASEHARDGFLQRLALGCALEHPDGNVKEEGKTAAELRPGDSRAPWALLLRRRAAHRRSFRRQEPCRHADTVRTDRSPDPTRAVRRKNYPGISS